MTLHLLTRVTATVGLPSHFEQAPHLPDILNRALLENSVTETQTIGPWIVFKPGVTVENATMITRRVVRDAESHVLYNCCTGGVAPDWTAYDFLTLGGCVTVKDDDGESVEGGQDRDEAEFFTIYGHIKGEGLEAITDSYSFEHAQAVGKWLAMVSGLSVNLEC